MAPTADNSSSGDPMGVLKLALSWLFVGIPLAWGVWKVIHTSLDLFRK
jgi:hypothetical protein